MVLIVEDDHALREMYRAAFVMSGYAVVAVEDGIDALQHVEEALPNVIGDSDSIDREARTRSSRVRHQARTVLVVDDEEAVQRLLRHFLELEKGFNVVTAGSVGEAILVLEHSPIDAVVLDVRMPRRSGLELLEYIRWNERFRDLPVLILTGAALTPDEEATIVRDHGYLFYKSENLEALAVQLNQLTD